MFRPTARRFACRRRLAVAACACPLRPRAAGCGTTGYWGGLAVASGAPARTTPPSVLRRASPPAAAGPRPECAAGRGRSTGQVRVALLLPLSGARWRRSATPCSRRRRWRCYDIGDATAGTDAARHEGHGRRCRRGGAPALADGARLILGPLLASEVEAAKPVARQAGVLDGRLHHRDAARRRRHLPSQLPAEAADRARHRVDARRRASTRFCGAGAEHALRPARERRATAPRCEANNATLDHIDITIPPPMR